MRTWLCIKFPHTIKRAKNSNNKWCISIDPDTNQDLELNITCYWTYTPGKYDGPWEFCYTDDEDFEIESAVYDNEELLSILTDSEIADIENKAYKYIGD
jgi:hypothetical protein